MREIETREKVERRERRNKIIIGIVLSVLMILGTAGYSFLSGGEDNGESIGKVSYNGNDFYRQGDFWQVNLEGKAFYFKYLPNETRNIVLKKTLVDYSGKPLYFTKNGAAEQEISQVLGNFASRIQLACYAGDNCTENLPVKNCSSNLIIIEDKVVGKNPIIEEDNCVYIFSNDSVRDADAFLYTLLKLK